MNSRIFFGLLLTTLTLTTMAYDSLRVETRGGRQFVIHEVDPGETVYAISRRYNVDVADLSSENNLVDNQLSVGQLLAVPFQSDANEPQVKADTVASGRHEVGAGETLFSIARQYNLSVEDLRDWNSLDGNELSVGQSLIVEDPNGVHEGGENLDVVAEDTIMAPEYIYYVQTGESLKTIAKKFDVPVDSIKDWNNLRGNRVKIGQELIFPFELESDSVLAEVTALPEYDDTYYGSKIRSSSEGGITRYIEEGVVKKIDSDIKTSKFLALHRTLGIGDVFQVTNPMNNESIYARVVGKLPDTGLNRNVMVRLTESAYDRLGILDDKSLVEIVYFD